MARDRDQRIAPGAENKHPPSNQLSWFTAARLSGFRRNQKGVARRCCRQRRGPICDRKSCQERPRHAPRSRWPARSTLTLRQDEKWRAHLVRWKQGVGLSPRWSQCTMQRSTETGTIRQRFARALHKDGTPSQRIGNQGLCGAAVCAGWIWGLRPNPRDCLVPQARGS